MRDTRIQVYLRYRGETIFDGNEFKTEQFPDKEDLTASIAEFVNETMDEMEQDDDTD